jgi:RING-type zinc-finger
VLESQSHEKTRELAATRDLLQREQVFAKRLERSLECQICRGERWDTVTGCGHLFGAECIKDWLKADSAWVEDEATVQSFLLLYQVPEPPHFSLHHGHIRQ